MAAVEVFNAGVGEQDLSRPQQFGYVNRQGTMAVPASFRYADSFSEGLVAVRPSEANEIAYIDASGQMVIPPMACHLAGPFTDGLARIQGPCGEAVGYINRAGEFVWPLRS
jgi:hypothetical protein